MNNTLRPKNRAFSSLIFRELPLVRNFCEPPVPKQTLIERAHVGYRAYKHVANNLVKVKIDGAFKRYTPLAADIVYQPGYFLLVFRMIIENSRKGR